MSTWVLILTMWSSEYDVRPLGSVVPGFKSWQDCHAAGLSARKQRAGRYIDHFCLEVPK